ncbi:MAG: hypothetical protein IKH55_05105, partial [Fibrobacter sp.]|nr:hypothetical protein [Fibrobacter sp.]
RKSIHIKKYNKRHVKKDPAKNAEPLQTQEFAQAKILGSEMRTQAFTLHSPYEFLFSCERKKRISTFIEIPKIKFFLRGE